MRPTHGLTAERICQALIETGFADPRVSVLAEHLGVAHSALYNHVKGLDEVIIGAVDRLFADAPPVRGHWEEALRDEALLRFGLERTHRGMYAAWRSTGRWSAAEIDRRARLMRVLLDDGWSGRGAVGAVQAVLDIAHAEAEQNTALDAWDGSAPERSTDRLDEYVDLFPPDLRPPFRALVADPTDYFTARLEITVAGLQHARPAGWQ